MSTNSIMTLKPEQNGSVFSDMMKTVLVILFTFFAGIAFGQDAQIQKILEAFDRRDYTQVRYLSDKFDESNLQITNRLDSLNFSLFQLVNFYTSEKSLLRSSPVYERKYKQALLFLEDNNLENFLPAFYVNYAYTYFKEHSDSSMEMLKKAIVIEREGKNKSHVISAANFSDALYLLDLLARAYDETYEDQWAMEYIQLYESNDHGMKIIPNQLLEKFKNIANSEFYDDQIRAKYCIDAFQLIQSESKINFDDELISDLLRFPRKMLYEKGNSTPLQIIIENFSPLLPSIERTINESYIDGFDTSSWSYFKEHYIALDTLDLDATPWLKSNIVNVFLYYLDTINKKYSDSEKGNYNPTFRLEYFDLWYKHNKKYGTRINELNALGNLMLLKNNYDVFYPEYDNMIIEKLFHDATMDVLYNYPDENILSNDLMTALKFRFGSIYQNFDSLEKVEKDIEKIFYTFKSKNSYSNFVDFADSYWSWIMGWAESLNKSKIEESRNGMLAILNESPSAEDISLRIKMCYNTKDLNHERLIAEDLYSSGAISQLRFEELQGEILAQLYYQIDASEKNARILHDFIIDNYSKIPSIKYYLTDAMQIAIKFRFSHALPELSNKVLEFLNENFENMQVAKQYYFYLTLGDFYDYIGRDNDATLFYFQARANPYHWQWSGSVEFIFRDLNLLQKMINSQLKQNLSEDARNSYSDYLESYHLVDSIFKNPMKIGDPLPKKLLIPYTQSRMDMGRRIAFYEGDIATQAAFIDEMINYERKNPYWGMEQLYWMKLDVSVQANEISPQLARQQLDSLYLSNNLEKDDNYYRRISSFGIEDQNYFNVKLSEFSKKLEQLNTINDLSFENQIEVLKSLAVSLESLEVSGIQNSFYQEPNKLRQIIEFRLVLDDFDKYNSRLLNLSDEQADKYFELLNQRYNLNIDDNDYLELKQKINEFDIFQQSIKSKITSAKPITLDKLQENLLDHQAYIRILQLRGNNDEYYAFITTNNELKVIKLNEGSIAEKVNYYHRQSVNKANDKNSYSFFFDQIQKSLPSHIEELFIKNDSDYNNINFEAIWNPEREKYVFDYLKINYVERPSSILNYNDSLEFNNAFLFGNPNFYGNSEENIELKSSVRSGLNLLPYTKTEIESINRILLENDIQTVVSDFNDSTEDYFYTHSNANILHLATHGFYIDNDTYNRYNYGLLAYGARDVLQNDFQRVNRADGVIFGGEIVLSNLTKSELVILSACETGVGTTGFFGGENLANAFLRAGAKNVISTIWPVDDKVTFEFMNEFYRNLMKGKNVAESLRQTKLNIKNKYPHPYYWAPFVLTQNRISDE